MKNVRLSGMFSALYIFFSLNSGAAPTKANLDLSLYGNAIEEASQSGRVAGGKIAGFLEHQFSPSLISKLQVDLKIETGASQSNYIDEFAPKQAPKLREATLNYLPFSYASLSLGAINQNRLGLPLLISDQTFVGAFERLSLPMDGAEIFIELEQAVPTSSTQFSKLPSFFWGKLGTEVKPFSYLNLELHGGRFAFQDLGEAAANRSRFWGNSIDGIGNAQSRFVYGYDVWELGGKIEFPFRDFTPYASFQWLTNTQAVSNQGFVSEIGSKVEASPSFLFNPRGQFFALASDLVPAFYTSEKIGHCNRVGYSIAIDFMLPKEETRFSLSWVSSEPILNSSFQDSFRYLSIAVATSYRLL